MKMNGISGLLVTGALCLAAAVPAMAQQNGISGSRHDLSTGGKGDIKAVTEKQVCVFCHTPHGASPAVPLWNHTLSKSVYTPYNSSTYVQTSPQTVSPRSKLCLSCHDGSIAELGQTVNNGLIETTGTMPQAELIGKKSSLKSDHPFGFKMPARDDGEIRLSLTAASPATADPAVKLYGDAIECVTCHEPHVAGRDTAYQFMVRSNTDSAICKACHDTSRGELSGWNSGAHAIATNRPGIGSGLPYSDPSTVATNACSSCHAGHNGGGTGDRLLRGAEDAYSTCATCHSAAARLTPAAPDVMSTVTKKTYSHPMLKSTAMHDPVEALPVSSSRHAACQDCHDPHASQKPRANEVPPGVPGSMTGVNGVSAVDGVGVIAAAANEYEVCFKCHGNSKNKPQNATYTGYGYTPYRVSYDGGGDPYNVRAILQTGASRHNVTRPSRGTVSPSLRTNILDLGGGTGRALSGPGTFLYCTDCHNNDTSGRAGSPIKDSNGPHGSNNYHLLERRYEYEAPPAVRGGLTTGPAYSAGPSGPYALCEKCHDLGTLVTDVKNQDTVFHYHYEHMVLGQASCATCHAGHGAGNASLIDFDKTIVGPGNGDTLEIDTGAKTCTLECHGKKHNKKSYAKAR